jgi:hypothetical protein
MFWPTLAGVPARKLANHAAGGRAGIWFGEFLRSALLDAVVGASMLGMALRTLTPDAPANAPKLGRRDAFVSTLIAFLRSATKGRCHCGTVRRLCQSGSGGGEYDHRRALGVVSIRALLG